MNKLYMVAFAFSLVVVASSEVRAENESTTNATAILRQAIRQLQKIGRNNPVTPESAPKSYYGDGGCPNFKACCSEVNGRFKYGCSYRMRPDLECAWKDRARRIGEVRDFSDMDREPVWKLLDRRPETYTFEDVLKIIGKPHRSHMLHCRNCGGKDMRWEYVAYGRDDYGDPIRHTLTFSFAPDGRCTGWAWLAEPQVSDETVLHR